MRFMCIHVDVYVYMCIYGYMYICTEICTHVYMYRCIYVRQSPMGSSAWTPPFDSHAIEYLLVRSQGPNICGPFTSVCFNVYQLCARRSTGLQNPNCPSHLRTLSFEILKRGPRKPA